MWNKLYNAAVKVQNSRTISPFIDAGGVVAAILTKQGNIYVGVCIDTASTLGMCAERNAIANMITNGESQYIRHQIDNAKMKPTLDMDYEKYINLLEPICDKLSIVSKRVWQIKMLDTVMLREVLKSTNEIMPEIIKAKEVAQCVQEREESQLE